MAIDPPLGRKLRIVALHSGASNSNVFKFQLAQFRRCLGGDAVWLIPDAPVAWEPDVGRRAVYRGTQPGMSEYFSEKSEFEKRLAGGKPFRQWFRLDGTQELDGANREDYLESVAYFMEYVEKEQPVDAVVTLAMGNFVVAGAMERYKKRQVAVPWRLTMCFNPIPGWGDAEPPLAGPLFVVDSGSHGDMQRVRALYPNLVVMDHSDGLLMPTSQPRASEVYERLASELRKLAGPRGTAASQSTARRPGGRRAEESEEEEAVGGEAKAITPSRLAELLRARSCVVADTRPLALMRARPFPAAKDEFSVLELKTMHPTEARRRLAPFRRGVGRQVVAISTHGDRCRECCAMLIRQFDFRADKVCRLEGGLRSWELWESEHRQASNQIRQAYGLPSSAADRDVPGIGAEELAELMRAGSCLVLDARELAEVRGKIFPGAYRDVSLFTLQKTPAEAKKRLDGLVIDGKRVVVISVTGHRCRRYCTLLIEQFAFPAGSTCYLLGGIRGWDEWAVEHPEANDEIRIAHNLPPSRGRVLIKQDHDEAGAIAREYSLSLLRS